MQFLTKASEYFKGAYSEMKRVVWPTRKQTIHYSIAVVALSIGIAVFFAVLDYFFGLGLSWLVR